MIDVTKFSEKGFAEITVLEMILKEMQDEITKIKNETPVRIIWNEEHSSSEIVNDTSNKVSVIPLNLEPTDSISNINVFYKYGTVSPQKGFLLTSDIVKVTNNLLTVQNFPTDVTKVYVTYQY